MTQAPYGSWKSPITTDFLVDESIGLSAPCVDGEDVYWTESRPREAGRQVIVRRSPDGRTTDVTPAPYNARTRVHEYGGGEYVAHNGVVYFSHFEDQRIYRVVRDARPTPVTAAGPMRYADYVVDAWHGRLIAVREDHSQGAAKPVNTLVAVPLDEPGHGTILVAGNDFYAAPRLSPDGRWLSWLTWNHPNMPWDGTELYVAAIEPDGSVGPATLVAGGVEESIVQPEWALDGTLYFVSDRTGWWNLYRYDGDAVNAELTMEAEFARPAWVFGQSMFAHALGGLVAIYEREGFSHLIRVLNGRVHEIPLPFTVLDGVRALGEDRVVLSAASGSEPVQNIIVDGKGHYQVLRRASDVILDRAYISEPEAVSFPTGDGAVAHGFYYPPKNPEYEGMPGEKPPLLVFTHGGPTGATLPVLSFARLFWTSRGFAVVDVNYRGSTGYGRAFRNALAGNWGVFDIEDSVAAARHLAGRGLADPDRLAIRGGSAGGYTTLAAATFTDTFKAGASYFGVSDLGALARDTHKFESHYLDRMVGPWPAEEATYRARSPLFHLDRLRTPLILLQGLDDRVVPPNQAEMMVEALRERGIPVAYVAFPGEGHGFRQAPNIKRATEAEYRFYSRILGFPTADETEPLRIWNLD